MNGPVDLVGEDEVAVDIGVFGEIALEKLRLSVLAQNFQRFAVERYRALRACRLQLSKRDSAACGDELLFDGQSSALEIETSPGETGKFASPADRQVRQPCDTARSG